LDTFVGVQRLRNTREDAIAEVLKELILALPGHDARRGT
jgi:hypothetical protein